MGQGNILKFQPSSLKIATFLLNKKCPYFFIIHFLIMKLGLEEKSNFLIELHSYS